MLILSSSFDVSNTRSTDSSCSSFLYLFSFSFTSISSASSSLLSNPNLSTSLSFSASSTSTPSLIIRPSSIDSTSTKEEASLVDKNKEIAHKKAAKSNVIAFDRTDGE